MAFETIFEFSEFTFEFTCKILIHFFINGKKNYNFIRIGSVYCKG